MLEAQLREKLQQKPILLMTHMVCGYPSFEANWQMLECFERAGVDIVEMQFPFSEPVADGALFAMANQAALEAGVRLRDCFDFMARATAHFSFPILMMGYYNTVFRQGEEAFCQRIAECGGQGLIIPDITLEESSGLREACRRNQLDFIPLVAPTTSEERLGPVVQAGSGFLYAVARKGVTGAATGMDHTTARYLQRIRAHSSLPLAVGFGISQSDQIAFLQGKADIAVLGSAVLRTWLDQGAQGVDSLLAQLRPNS